VTSSAGALAAPARDRGLYVIAAFKLTGVLLMSTIGLGAMHLLNADAVAVVAGWVDAIGADVKGDFVRDLLARIAGMPRQRFEEIGFGAFGYAAVLLVQGVGLLRQQRWAEWLTVLLTGAFIPLECWELLKGVTLPKVGLLVVNVAIVAYLVRHLRAKHRNT
jgi:uncharacterized membrane protein (DUF2068 family)